MIVAGAVLLLVALASWDLRLPGLYYDELIQIVPALQLARGPLASPVGFGPPGGQVLLFGHVIPFMTMAYMGAVKQFAFLPVAWLVGTTPESIRFFSIGMAVLAMLATYAFARQILGPVIGAIGVLLLATDPTIVFVARADYGSTTLTMLLLKGLALWQLTLWWAVGSAWALFFGSLALGVGIYDKADFAWVVAAIGAAVLVVAPRGLRARLSLQRLLVAGAGLVAGAWPLIWFNLTWPPPTLAALSSPLMHDDSTISARLVERSGILANMLDGREASIWLGGAAPTISVVSVMVGAAAIVIVGSCLSRRARAAAGPPAFVLACGAFVLLAAALTFGGFAMHHIVQTYPFPQLTLAGGLGLVSSKLRQTLARGRMVSTLVLCLGVLVPVGSNVANVVTVSRGLERLGGYGNWSDAIYRLNDALLTEPERPVAVLDWGIHLNLVALSQGRLKSYEMFWGLIDPAAPPDSLRQALAHPEYRYVLHTDEVTNFRAPRDRFFAEVRQSQRRAQLSYRIDSRDGQPVFEVYDVD
jgi:hypothetical protein